MRRVFIALAGLLTAGCGLLPRSAPLALDVWYVAATAAQARTDSITVTEGGLIVLDTVALRPILWRRGYPRISDLEIDSATTAEFLTAEPLTFTTYRGSRYHPEAIRALTENAAVLDAFADSLTRFVNDSGGALVLDVQEMPPGDVRGLVAFIRAVRASLPERTKLAITVPAGDTLAYPTRVLARAANTILVRLDGEHGRGTAPGAPVTPDFIRRELGARSIGIGASRIVAGFPLYGTIWRGGSAAAITFAEASALVAAEAGAFRRDPASGYLTASGRDGWTVWVPDESTVRLFIATAESRGVHRVALMGTTGADRAIIRSSAVRR